VKVVRRQGVLAGPGMGTVEAHLSLGRRHRVRRGPLMRLALTMIVRNEEAHLGTCLDSVKALVDEIVVVDTGSTDGTVAMARSLGVLVLERPWHDDFAWARNEALQAARSDWVLVMDADERFEGRPSEVRKVLRKKGVVALEVPILSHLVGAEHMHSAIRLFRLAPGVHFERRLHEQVLPSIARTFPGGRVARAPFRLIHLGYREDEVRRKGKHERNLRLAEAEVAAHPEDAFASLNVGVEYMASGDAERAVAAFERSRALIVTPEHWHSRLYKIEAQALLALSRREEATARIDEGIGLFPTFTDLYFMKGVALYDAGQLDEASRLFRRCLRMGPASTPPHDGVDPYLGTAAPLYMLGRIALDRGRSAEAFSLLEKSLRRRPDSLEAIESLVRSAMMTGRDLAEIAASSPPPDPLALGAVLFRLGDPTHALQAFESSEKLYPSLPAEHHLVVAACHLRLNQVDEAEMRVALAGDPGGFGARAFIADALRLRQGRLSREEAKAAYPASHPFWLLTGESGAPKGS